MKIDGLDSDSVDTNEIIKVYKHVFTKYVDKEPDDLEKAIEEIQKFLLVDTPRYVKGKEPKYDSLNNLIDAGTEEKILYQFRPENQLLISKPLRVLDSAMKVIPSVAMDIRKQLNELKQSGVPLNVPMPVPTIDKKPGIMERLGLKNSDEREMSKADAQVEALIGYIYETRERYGYWLDWFYGSIKYDTNRGTWSDIYSRAGMERLLTRLVEFFNHWIIPRFLPIYQYHMDKQLDGLKADTNEFVKALARMQYESQQNMMGQP